MGSFFLSFLLLCLPISHAENVPVRFPEGTQRGFLVLRNETGNVIASGDMESVVHGGRIVMRLLFHFRDGSLDDETATYTQHSVFRLLTDHLVQKGPSFKKDLDFSLDVATGSVTEIATDAHGKRSSEQTHLDLPPDVSNGMLLALLSNIKVGADPVSVSYVAPLGKPRVIRLVISSEGEQSFTTGGVRRKATDFLIKPELGGITGVIAPMIGKQPASGHVWIATGPVPAFVREQSQFFEDGPLWSVEQVAPVPIH